VNVILLGEYMCVNYTDRVKRIRLDEEGSEVKINDFFRRLLDTTPKKLQFIKPDIATNEDRKFIIATDQKNLTIHLTKNTSINLYIHAKHVGNQKYSSLSCERLFQGIRENFDYSEDELFPEFDITLNLRSNGYKITKVECVKEVIRSQKLLIETPVIQFIVIIHRNRSVEESVDYETTYELSSKTGVLDMMTVIF